MSLDLAALAAAPICPGCGTQFLAAWCPVCRLGAPRTGPAMPFRGSGPRPRSPIGLRAAAALQRTLRRIGTAVRARQRPRGLCPTCFHLRATRCICGMYSQIQWFGETG